MFWDLIYVYFKRTNQLMGFVIEMMKKIWIDFVLFKVYHIFYEYLCQISIKETLKDVCKFSKFSCEYFGSI